MPIYEYWCPICGHVFEKLRLKGRIYLPEVACENPECNNGFCLRKMSTFTAIYKGAGFATTEARGITGRKRKPNIKVGNVGDLPPEEREKHLG